MTSSSMEKLKSFTIWPCAEHFNDLKIGVLLLNKTRIQVFGVVFFKDGISPASEKIETLQQASPPANAAEVLLKNDKL